MPRPLAGLLVLAAIVSVTPAAPVPKGKGAPSYFPTAVGTRWVYRETYSVGGRESVMEFTEVVTAVERRGDAKVVTVAQEWRGEFHPSHEVVVSGGGLFKSKRGTGQVAFEPPLCMLKLPPTPGTKWEVDSAINGGRIRGTRTVGEPEVVEVPAGKYKAVPVESATTYQGNSVSTTSWYAPGVGLVKSMGQVSSKVLKLFTPGKD